MEYLIVYKSTEYVGRFFPSPLESRVFTCFISADNDEAAVESAENRLSEIRMNARGEEFSLDFIIKAEGIVYQNPEILGRSK